MALDPQIKKMLKAISFQVKKHLSKTSAGTPTYAPAVLGTGYYGAGTRTTKSATDDESLLGMSLYLDGEVPLNAGITTDDIIILPDGTSPIPIAIRKYYDEKGNVVMAEVVY